MVELVELSSQAHQDLKVVPEEVIKFAASQHVLSISAQEIANAATCFPVFASRNQTNGAWGFSAMTSFTLAQNLFVQQSGWQTVFQPSSMKTYPLFLMESPADKSQYTIGFDPTNVALSKTQGKDLFSAPGQASEHLSLVSQLLEGELAQIRHSFAFANKIDSLGLFKEVDLQVNYASGQTNTIKSLHTIDEDKFKLLSAQDLAELNELGYLMPIHGMLMSIYQLNVLINKHNSYEGNLPVNSVKMEITKGFTHS